MIQVVDRGIFALLGRRMKLSLLVEEYKRSRGEPISRPEVELRRLNASAEPALHYGLNPEFARAILHCIIGESCKVQMIQLQDFAGLYPEAETEESREQRLKQNLLELTAQCAPTYDEQYGQAFYATRLHAGFEEAQISKLAQENTGGLGIDLGCATGRHTAHLAPHFTRVVGYDISPDMIGVAKQKNVAPNVEFQVQDLEEGIPLPDESVSLVIMSMGTASDIPRTPQLLREIRRVLKRGGRAFLSFYNSKALIYDWGFIPWPVGLAAELDIHKRCLNVLWDKDGMKHIYSVHAEPRAPEEVEELLPRGLALATSTTHPTLASILPDLLFGRENVQASVADLDLRLAQEGDNKGAYLTVIARKS
ncbi:MAG: methyltransferase domain-containing protein [Candidatus Wildermuthbacteria bacterium]|nr:methyltransferase domain-containing protein [Candidatus Wildermuthbacteria bacterium]